MIKKVESTHNNWIIYVLVAIVLIWYHCYGYVGLSSAGNIFNGLCYVIFIILLVYSLSEISIKKHPILTMLLISTLVSMMMSVFFWDQSLVSAFKSFRRYYLLIIYFYLFKISADKNQVEKALLILAIIYVFCWLYQIVKVPELVFGMDRDEALDDMSQRGFYRFWIPTKEHVAFIALFMFELFRRTKRNIYLIGTLLGFIVVILHVGRQMMFWTFVSLLLLILYFNREKWKRIVLMTILIFAIGYVLFQNIPTLNLVYEMTTEQVANANEDIRLQSMEFYLNHSMSNIFTFLFGNGVAGEGKLAAFHLRANTLGYYEGDIGYVALLFDFGLLGLMLYIALFIFIFRLPIEKKYVYLKCYLIYIFGSYAFSHTLTTNIFFNMCVLYILIASYIGRKKYLKYDLCKNARRSNPI